MVGIGVLVLVGVRVATVALIVVPSGVCVDIADVTGTRVKVAVLTGARVIVAGRKGVSVGVGLFGRAATTSGGSANTASTTAPRMQPSRLPMITAAMIC